MSELENLKDQIKRIDEMIVQETNEETRVEYEQTKMDLEELVSLMEEDEEKTQKSPDDDEIDEQDEDSAEIDDTSTGKNLVFFLKLILFSRITFYKKQGFKLI